MQCINSGCNSICGDQSKEEIYENDLWRFLIKLLFITKRALESEVIALYMDGNLSQFDKSQSSFKQGVTFAY